MLAELVAAQAHAMVLVAVLADQLQQAQPVGPVLTLRRQAALAAVHRTVARRDRRILDQLVVPEARPLTVVALAALVDRLAPAQRQMARLEPREPNGTLRTELAAAAGVRVSTTVR